MTMSCNEGSIRLRPEFPWRARRYWIVLEESEQYWKLFLLPPPFAIVLFHFSSDQWWQYKKCFWRLSLILQNSIAPSSSLGGHNRRLNILLVQHRSQVLSPIDVVHVDKLAECRLCGLLWPLIGLQNHPHSILTHILRTALLRFPARCCSNSWPTCLSHEKFWPTSEKCLCSWT